MHLHENPFTPHTQTWKQPLQIETSFLCAFLLFPQPFLPAHLFFLQGKRIKMEQDTREKSATPAEAGATPCLLLFCCVVFCLVSLLDVQIRMFSSLLGSPFNRTAGCSLTSHSRRRSHTHTDTCTHTHMQQIPEEIGVQYIYIYIEMFVYMYM